MDDPVFAGFAYTLAALVLGGLFTLAYKHPDAFKPMATFIMNISTAAMALLMSYSFGLIEAERMAIPLMPVAKLGQFHNTIIHASPHFTFWLPIYFLFMVYVFFLKALRLLGFSGEDKGEH